MQIIKHSSTIVLSKLYQQKHCAVFLWQHLMAKLTLDEVAPTPPGWNQMDENLPPFLDQNMRKSNWEAIPSNKFRSEGDK